MRRTRAVAGPVLLSAGLLSGCVDAPPPSYLTTITPGDAGPLADAVDGYVRPTLRRQGAVIVLDAPAGDTDLAPKLRALLIEQGYRVVDVAEQGSHRVGYAVSTFAPGGLLVQVFVDDRRAARLYARDDGGALRPRGPYTAVEPGP